MAYPFREYITRLEPQKGVFQKKIHDLYPIAEPIVARMDPACHRTVVDGIAKLNKNRAENGFDVFNKIEMDFHNQDPEGIMRACIGPIVTEIMGAVRCGWFNGDDIMCRSDYAPKVWGTRFAAILATIEYLVNINVSKMIQVNIGENKHVEKLVRMELAKSNTSVVDRNYFQSFLALLHGNRMTRVARTALSMKDLWSSTTFWLVRIIPLVSFVGSYAIQQNWIRSSDLFRMVDNLFQLFFIGVAAMKQTRGLFTAAYYVIMSFYKWFRTQPRKGLPEEPPAELFDKKVIPVEIKEVVLVKEPICIRDPKRPCSTKYAKARKENAWSRKELIKFTTENCPQINLKKRPTITAMCKAIPTK